VLPVVFFAIVLLSILGPRWLWLKTARKPWLEKSIVLLEQGHALDAHHPSIQFRLIQAYQMQGQTSKAFDLLQTTARNYPRLAWPHLFLGELYESQEKWQDAIARYEHAIEIAPDSAQAYLALAKLYEKQGAWDASFAFYRRALDRERGQDRKVDLDLDAVYRLFDDPGVVLDGTRVKRTIWTIDGRPQRTIFQHPPSRIEYSVQVPRAARFVSSFALAPEVWQPERGDGVRFEVHIAGHGVERRVFSQTIDPKNVPSDRRWHDLDLDLTPWAGEVVTLSLSTAPGPNGDDRYDWAGWGAPRITRSAYFDFLDQFVQAGTDVGGPNVFRSQMRIDGDTRPVLFQHPPSRVVYSHVRILDRSTLSLGIGIDPQVWSADWGDGTEFQVWVREGSAQPVQIYAQYLDPKHDPEHRGWFDTHIDLDRFAGQTVEIHFVTLPGPAGDDRYDWSAWSAPGLFTSSTGRMDDHG
jgi:hypothetical protein